MKSAEDWYNAFDGLPQRPMLDVEDIKLIQEDAKKLSREEVIEKFKKFLLSLPEEERVSILYDLEICSHCGREGSGSCYCMRDD